MTQNRNKLIDLFIGNASNTILHRILEKAILGLKNHEVAGKYRKEINTSYDAAKKYREKINPLNPPFPERDIKEIKDKILRRVKSELNTRISLGYLNIDINSLEKETENFLREMKVA